MHPLRDYQRKACNEICRRWRDGEALRQVLVLPTGGGKTRCAAEIAQRALDAGAKVLAVCHRRELVAQLVERLPQAGRVGSGRPVQVTTLQSMLTRPIEHDADLLIADECHHLPQGQAWVRCLDQWSGARWLGLTATPERADGAPLGDTFDSLVVGAQYSDLLRDGHLVPCRVFHPPASISDGVALDPLVAYHRYADGGQAFIFTDSVIKAHEIAGAFCDAGILAGVIEANTPKVDRDEELEMFRRGRRRALVNVFTLTEGVDVPAADVAILGRGFGHASSYLQAVGRVLRAAPDKTEARVIDLCGAVLAHGLPTSDRKYSLEGEAITAVAKGRGLRVCLQCGLTYEAGPVACPGCGHVHTPEGKRPRIYSIDLEEHYAGADTPQTNKAIELARLRGVARKQGYSPGWVIKQYRALFGSPPPGFAFDDDEKRGEWDRLVGIARARGYRPGFAYARYKAAFGCDPPWGWR